MKQPVFLRLAVMFAFIVMVFAGGCTKQEKRSENGGEAPQEPSTKPGGGDTPCLRIALLDEEEDNHEEGDEEEADHDDEEHEDEDGIGSSKSSSDCDDKDKDPVTTTPSSTGTGEKVGGGYNVGPGIPGCEEKNEAWIAVKSGGPGQCGGTLVKWCCSESEIATRFPTVAEKLAPKIADIVGGGLKLYHCSEDAGKTTFHFATSKAGGGVQYKTLYVSSTNSKDGDTKGDSCPVVTMEDMGFKTTTGGTTPTTEVPASIGELLDTSKAALLDFLKGNEYGTWAKDAAVRATAGPHGKVKIFFNAKLKSSMLADSAEKEVGSIAVKEIYNDDGLTLKGYSIMAKHKAGTDKDSWLFYEVLGGSPDFNEEKAYGVGVSECSECHKAGKDFIQATLP